MEYTDPIQSKLSRWLYVYCVMSALEQLDEALLMRGRGLSFSCAHFIASLEYFKRASATRVSMGR